MTAAHYDLVVIGSGPAGQKGAVAAAKRGRRVAIVDRRAMAGGSSLHRGTIPSKTLREAIIYLTGIRQRSFYGVDYRERDHIDMRDLTARVRPVLERETAVVRAQLERNGIALIDGLARFIDPCRLEVETENGTKQLSAEHILIACGTRPANSPGVPIDGRRVFDSDQILQLERIPRELVIVGAGVIGLEYASMMAALGIRVTLVEQRKTVLDFVDQEILGALMYHLRSMGVTFRLGEEVVAVECSDSTPVTTRLASGKVIRSDALLHAVGRRGNADSLSIEAAGLVTDSRGRIAVNECFQTAVSHIYAAGDVVGFPALAATSMEQGRLACEHFMGGASRFSPELMPYGIYTIPEISMVGRTEEELTAAAIPYEIGVSRFRELAKGQMVGDEIGMLKLLFDPVSLRLLGVHVIGESAAEIAHVGQAVLSLGGTMEYFRDTVFNYPTFAEAYKVAALNGLNRVGSGFGVPERSVKLAAD